MERKVVTGNFWFGAWEEVSMERLMLEDSNWNDIKKIADMLKWASSRRRNNGEQRHHSRFKSLPKREQYNHNRSKRWSWWFWRTLREESNWEHLRHYGSSRRKQQGTAEDHHRKMYTTTKVTGFFLAMLKSIMLRQLQFWIDK